MCWPASWIISPSSIAGLAISRSKACATRCAKCWRRFPVYRTYVRSDQTEVDPQDRRQVNIAIREAKRRNPAISESVFDFIQSVLLLEHPDGVDDAQRAERQLFVMRFQQLSSPVMAKGVEDTAFYRYYPLASLNEVGGDPARFGVSVECVPSPQSDPRANCGPTA